MALAALVFAIAALGGASLALLHFMGRPRPLPLAVVHLLVAASALVLLLRAVAIDSTNLIANVAAGIMLVVALGGFVLLSYRLRSLPLPTPMVLIHGLAAVVGFGTLLAAIFTQGG
jgi:hypothetical protein